MKKKAKRTPFFLILAVLVISLSLTACKRDKVEEPLKEVKEVTEKEVEESAKGKMSLDEAKLMLEKAIKDTKALDEIIYCELEADEADLDFEEYYNPNVEPSSYMGQTERALISGYNTKELPKFPNIQERKDAINKLYAEDFAKQMIYENFYGIYPSLLEIDGEEYFSATYQYCPVGDENIEFDIDTLEISYETKDRLVLYADYTEEGIEREEKHRGKIVFLNEGGEWKLSSYLTKWADDPTRSGDPTEKIKLKEAVDLAGKKENGYRLAKPIDEYITEFDENPIYINEKLMYGLNIYSIENDELVLEDKMFVSTTGKDGVVLPERDDTGIINLNYSAFNKDLNDSKYVAVGYGGFVSEENSIDEVINLFIKRGLIDWNSDVDTQFIYGNEAYLIIPKYYGTKITVELVNTENREIKYRIITTDSPFFYGCNISEIQPNTIVEVKYKDKSFDFSPAISLKDGEITIPEEAINISEE